MKTIIEVAVMSALIASTAGAAAAAAERGMANDGYWGDRTGHLVSDRWGGCIRSGTWTPKLALKECDPQYFAAKETPKKVEPKKEMPAASAAPPTPPPMHTVTLTGSALFGHDQASLRAEGRHALDQLVGELRNAAETGIIHVVGYTDSQGTEAYNQKLSERRADSVRDYLIHKGVPANRIDASGKGESNPVASNVTAQGRAQNRRVEITVEVKRHAQ